MPKPHPMNFINLHSTKRWRNASFTLFIFDLISHLFIYFGLEGVEVATGEGGFLVRDIGAFSFNSSVFDVLLFSLVRTLFLIAMYIWQESPNAWWIIASTSCTSIYLLVKGAMAVGNASFLRFWPSLSLVIISFIYVWIELFVLVLAAPFDGKDDHKEPSPIISSSSTLAQPLIHSVSASASDDSNPSRSHPVHIPNNDSRAINGDYGNSITASAATMYFSAPESFISLSSSDEGDEEQEPVQEHHTLADSIMKTVLRYKRECENEDGEKENGWEFVTEKNGVRIIRKYNSATGLYVSIGIGIVEIPPWKLANFIVDVDRKSDYDQQFHRADAPMIVFSSGSGDMGEMTIEHVYMKPKMGTSPRDFVFYMLKKQVNDTCYLVSRSLENSEATHPSTSNSTEYVRGRVGEGGWIFEPLSPATTRVIYILDMDPCGNVPAFVLNSIGKTSPLRIGVIRDIMLRDIAKGVEFGGPFPFISQS